jgi:hypothetical protein
VIGALVNPALVTWIGFTYRHSKLRAAEPPRRKAAPARG